MRTVQLKLMGWLLLGTILYACKKEAQGPNLTGWSTPYQINNQIENSNPEIRAISQDKQGIFWIVSGGLVAHYNGSGWVNDTVSKSMWPFGTCIAIDSHNNKWFGFNQAQGPIVNIGLIEYNGLKWISYDTTNSGIAGNLISSLAIDTLDNVWIGTNANGVSKFDGSNWTTYNTGNGLISNQVTSVAIDREGNKWFGTKNGVSFFDGTHWTSYTKTNGLSDNDIFTIVIDKQDNKWFGTLNGLTKYDGTHWIVYNNTNSGINSGIVINPVYSIAIDDNQNIWVGFEGGVTKYNGSSWVTYTPSNSGLSYGEVYCIYIDTQGNKWIGTDNGINEFKN